MLNRVSIRGLSFAVRRAGGARQTTLDDDAAAEEAAEKQAAFRIDLLRSLNTADAVMEDAQAAEEVC